MKNTYKKIVISVKIGLNETKLTYNTLRIICVIAQSRRQNSIAKNVVPSKFFSVVKI